LDDEIVNTAQGVAKFEKMVEQQIWISNAQNADCGDDVRHRYCNTMFWFKCKDVIEDVDRATPLPCGAWTNVKR
jgi:hypothetical protein